MSLKSGKTGEAQLNCSNFTGLSAYHKACLYPLKIVQAGFDSLIRNPGPNMLE